MAHFTTDVIADINHLSDVCLFLKKIKRYYSDLKVGNYTNFCIAKIRQLHKRIMSVDYGTKKIGLAISDENWKIAFPIETVIGNWDRPHLAAEMLLTYVTKHNVAAAVIGLPKSSDSNLNERCMFVYQMAKCIQHHVPVLLFDERYTTASVYSIGNFEKHHTNKRVYCREKAFNKKTYDDAEAACILLNDALVIIDSKIDK